RTFNVRWQRPALAAVALHRLSSDRQRLWPVAVQAFGDAGLEVAPVASAPAVASASAAASPTAAVAIGYEASFVPIALAPLQLADVFVVLAASPPSNLAKSLSPVCRCNDSIVHKVREVADRKASVAVGGVEQLVEALVAGSNGSSSRSPDNLLRE